METIDQRTTWQVQPSLLVRWAYDYWALALVLTLGLACRLALAALPLRTSLGISVPDDAYYYFTIARNWANGFGITSDRLTPTNGFHPLWLLLITPIWRLVSSSDLAAHLALAMSGLLNCLAGLIIYLLTMRVTASKQAALLGLAIFLFNPYGITSAVNGLETSLALVFFGLCLLNQWSLWKAQRISSQRWFMTGVLWGGLLLARTDYIFIVVALALSLLYQKRKSISLANVLIVAVGGGLTLAPWLLWNLYVFGTVSQVSGEAYPYYLHALWVYQNGTAIQPLMREELTLLIDMVKNLGRTLGFGSLLPLVALGSSIILIYFRKHLRQPIGFLIAPTLGATLLLLFHALYRWMFVDWYFSPLAYVVAIWLALAIAALWQHNQKILGEAAVVCLLALYLYSAWSLAYKGGVYPQQAVDASAIQCSPNSIIGVSDSGWVGYQNACQVVNLDGVVNNDAYYAIRNGKFNNYVSNLRLNAVYLDDIITQLVEYKEGRVPRPQSSH